MLLCLASEHREGASSSRQRRKHKLNMSDWPSACRKEGVLQHITRHYRTCDHRTCDHLRDLPGREVRQPELADLALRD